jgi:hypothetical protein
MEMDHGNGLFRNQEDKPLSDQQHDEPPQR